MRIQKVIQELSNGAAPISATLLTQLSNLDPGEAAGVVGVLQQVTSERRRLIVRRLTELAEDNVDLNFDPLFRRCIHDEDGEVRAMAILGLWECEERSLIEPLVRLLKHDPDEQVRIAAAQSLGRFALLAELGKLLKRDSRKIEEALLQTIEGDPDTSSEIRRRAVEAIAPINKPGVREIIRETYQSADEKLRASALYAMGRNGDPDWIPYILEGMESPSPEPRYEAAVAAGQLGDESLVSPLVHLVDDPEAQVQAAAVAALSTVGGAAAIRALRQLLSASEDRLRELAQDALESMASHEGPAADILRRRSQSPAERARSIGDGDMDEEEPEE